MVHLSQKTKIALDQEMIHEINRSFRNRHDDDDDDLCFMATFVHMAG